MIILRTRALKDEVATQVAELKRCQAELDLARVQLKRHALDKLAEPEGLAAGAALGLIAGYWMAPGAEDSEPEGDEHQSTAEGILDQLLSQAMVLFRTWLAASVARTAAGAMGGEHSDG